MSDLKREQRNMMVAHLCEIIPAMMRERRDASSVVYHLLELTNPDTDAEYEYVEGLIGADMSTDDINAAVADIAAGRHPATSLVGRLLTWRENAMTTDGAPGVDPKWSARAGGNVEALDRVLALLGVEVPR